MDQHNHSIIASSALKTCPRDGCQLKLVKSGSRFVWRCTCCEYEEELNDVHTDRHTFSYIPQLGELKISWPGCPKMVQYLDLAECRELQRLLAEVCQ